MSFQICVFPASLLYQVVGRLAYCGGLILVAAGCGSGLHLSAPEPTSTVSFEVSEGTALAFDLSRDGRTIVFDLLGQLWLLPAEGGAARPLTNAAAASADHTDPAFSSDGRRVAFLSDGPVEGLRSMWLDGPALRPPADSGIFIPAGLAPAGAPDDLRIAFTRDGAIHILELQSGQTQPLRIEGLQAPQVGAPSWSPDGSRIVFANATAASGRHIFEVNASGGTAVPLVTTVSGWAPVLSPDGSRVAFLSRGAGGRPQIWTQARGDSAPRLLVGSGDISFQRLRWFPDSQSLLYSADGKLWRYRLAASAPQQIAFTANVTVERQHAVLRPVRFAVPGTSLPARGHMGLALSPDAKRIGMIALGKLWVFPLGRVPTPVTPLPATAAGLAWSPDGREIAWSAGAGGAADLFATSVATGTTRRLTGLPGSEERPSWSPDGRWLAFLHTQRVVSTRLRVIPAGGEPVERLEDSRDLGAVSFDWAYSFQTLGQEIPQWSPRSDALLMFTEGATRLIPLQGAPQRIPRLPAGRTFVAWYADSSLVYLRENQLWGTQILTDSTRRREPVQLSQDTALYPSVARDGSVLYVSTDGLRLRRPDGTTTRYGWPLTYTTPEAPSALLVRNARIIAADGAPPQGLNDLLLESGRIARIGPAGTLRAADRTPVLDAEGRTVIPGLIDLHEHAWDDAVYPAALYFGVTTVREMGSGIGRVAGFHDAIAAGVFPGPRVVFGGFMFRPRSVGMGLAGVTIQEPSDAAADGRGIALAQAFGADYLKMPIPYTAGAGARFARAARAAGFRTSGHCSHGLPLVAAGVAGKEHLGVSCGTRSDGVWYNDLIQLFHAAGMWVVPTIVAFSSTPYILADTAVLSDPDIEPFETPFLRSWALRLPPASVEAYGRFAATARAATAKLHRAGVVIGAGSDAPHLPGAIHTELEELVRAGLTPQEAIAAATGVAARILGAEAEIGTIAVGKRADLVILDADPLQDIRNTRRIWRVLKGGAVVDRARLREHARN